MKRAIINVEKDMSKSGLQLNTKKTELMILTRRSTEVASFIKIGKTTIWPKSEMKYLGVWLDCNLSWAVHTCKMHEKACKPIPKLQRIARKTYGYNTHSRRIMLEGTIKSYFRYACAVYAHRLHINSVTKYIERAHRAMLLCYHRLILASNSNM